MKLFNFSRKKSNVENRQYFPYIQQYFNSGLYAGENNPVVDTVISKISNVVGILPIYLCVHTSNGDKEAIWDSNYQLLKDPAVEESPMTFYRTIVRMVLAKGNCYIFKHKNSKGEAIALELVDPNSVMVTRAENGMKLYNITGGSRGGVYTDRDIIHIYYYGEGYNGTIGQSPIKIHSDVIKRNWIISEYIRMFFDNSMPSRLLVTLGESFKPGSPKMNQLVQEMNEYFNRFVLGQVNLGRPLITPPDSKISTLEMGSNVQSDVMNLYEQSCEEICRLFDCPPAVIFDKSNKYNSLGQRQQDFLISCVQPLCTHIGQCLVKGLVEPEYQSVSYIRWDYTVMTETDASSKADYISKLLHNGIYTLDEARQHLGLSTVDNDTEGSTRWIPANLMPLTQTTIESYMAKSQLALAEAKNNYEHNPIGDDKV